MRQLEFDFGEAESVSPPSCVELNAHRNVVQCPRTFLSPKMIRKTIFIIGGAALAWMIIVLKHNEDVRSYERRQKMREERNAEPPRDQPRIFRRGELV